MHVAILNEGAIGPHDIVTVALMKSLELKQYLHLHSLVREKGDNFKCNNLFGGNVHSLFYKTASTLTKCTIAYKVRQLYLNIQLFVSLDFREVFNG